MHFALLSFVIAFATFHGQVVDETATHRPVAHVRLKLCDAVKSRQAKTATCGRYVMRLSTNGDGRFSISNVRPGSYIVAGRSNDVGWFAGLWTLGASSAEKPAKLYVCNYETQPRDCAPPSFGRNIPL